MRTCQLMFMQRKMQEERQSCVFVCRRVHGGRWWSGGLEQRCVCVCVCVYLSSPQALFRDVRCHASWAPAVWEAAVKETGTSATHTHTHTHREREIERGCFLLTFRLTWEPEVIFFLRKQTKRRCKLIRWIYLNTASIDERF